MNYLLLCLVLAQPIGVNLDPIRDWNTAAPYSDLSYMFREWGEVERPWVKYNGPLTYDNYPLEDAEALTFAIGYPDGTYEVSYLGEGTVTFHGFSRLAGDWITQHGRRKNILVIHRSKRYDFMSVAIRNINRQNPIRDLQIRAYDYYGFTDLFLEKLKPFKCLRFMDWMETNGSPIVRWADRALPSRFGTPDSRGVPYEHITELSNLTKCDIWINIPHNADITYIVGMANFLKQNLYHNQKVYLEYSNEIWNSSFRQFHELIAQARSHQELTAPDDFGRLAQLTALRLKFIGEIFRSIFWERPYLICPVLCGQLANRYFLETGLDYINRRFGAPNRFFDYLGVAPYLNIDPERDLPNLEMSQLFNGMEDYFKDAKFWIRQNHQLASRFSLTLVAYEGGQHLVAWNPLLRAEVNDELKRAAQDQVKMGDLYRALLMEWNRHGSLFMHYSHVSSKSKWGSWGLLERIDQETSVKWEALTK